MACRCAAFYLLLGIWVQGCHAARLSHNLAEAIRSEGSASVGDTEKGNLEKEHAETNATAQRIKTNGRNYVFVEVHMLAGTESIQSVGNVVRASAGDNIAGLVQVAEGSNITTGAFYHSETVFCSRSSFTQQEQHYLDGLLDGFWVTTSYEELPEDWWTKSRAQCITLSYGGGRNTDGCSGVSMFRQSMSDRRAGIGNADPSNIWKYLYGTTDLSALDARSYMCRGTCGPDWSSNAYHPVSRNCNYFTSVLMDCTLDLSQSLPYLGVSDLRRSWACSSCK